jgi:hypothetical protein
LALAFPPVYPHLGGDLRDALSRDTESLRDAFILEIWVIEHRTNPRECFLFAQALEQAQLTFSAV